MTSPQSRPWRPIEDLPDDWQALVRPDLDELLQIWNAERQSLRAPERVEQLQERLSNLWAIETGIIERLYTVDRGVTETMVEVGFEAIEQFSTTGQITSEAADLIKDQRAALDLVFAYIRGDRPLTLSYIRELHQLLTRNQTHTDAVDQFGQHFQAELLRGEWKKLANNPTRPDGTVHEYSPPLLVPDEMDRLVAMHAQHEAIGVRPEIEAAWLHHRFAQIHPFQEGNGRVARAIATMVFLKAGFLPLVVRSDEHRERYLDALEQADAGDLKPLIDSFANIQTTDLNDAITFVREMQGASIRAIAQAAAEAAKRRATPDAAGLRDLTEHYVALARNRLSAVGGEIQNTIRDSVPDDSNSLDAWVRVSGITADVTENHSRWTSEILSATQQFRYAPNLTRYKRWAALYLPDPAMDGVRWVVVVSFHHKEARAGAMAAVLFITTSDDSSTNGAEDDRPVIVGSNTEFTYSGSQPVDDRFRAWLEAGLTSALSKWQARL